MAKIAAVFQDNVFQDNAFQDNEWGFSPFQKNVFQGESTVSVFQNNVFQLGGLFQDLEYSGFVFDVPDITHLVKILNETLQSSETLLRRKDIALTLNESESIAEFDGLVRAILLAINEVLQSSETENHNMAMFRTVTESLALNESSNRIKDMARMINESESHGE